MSDRLIALILLIALALTLVCLLVLVGHGVRSRRRRRLHPQVRAAALRLQAALADVSEIPGAVEAFRDLPLRPAAEQLADIADTVTGEELRRVALVAEQAGVTPRLAAWCVDRRWWRRLFGVRMLSRLGLDEPLLLALLGDPYPAVRAAATEAAGADPSPSVVRRLLDLLDDSDRFVRFSAQGALDSAGPTATDAVLRYVSDGSSPQLAAGLQVARSRADPRFLAPALALRSRGLPQPADGDRSGVERARTGSAAVREASAGLLGAVGGEVAAAALADLLGDPEPSVRVAAVAGLARTASPGHAPRLAQALDDPDWEVRRAAVAALQDLGAIGTLYLRSARREGGPAAAAIAAVALSEPEGLG